MKWQKHLRMNSIRFINRGRTLAWKFGRIFFVNKEDGTNDRNDSKQSFSRSNNLSDTSKLAASDSAEGTAEEGNGKNAKKLGDVQFVGIESLNGSTIQTYFQSLIGQLGVDGRQAERMHSTRKH